jgi:predicted TIM-barrel fold metal-dependent hydrolase
VIIDFHTHITAPEIIARRDEYLVRNAWFRDPCADPDARLSSAAALVAAMDEASVDQAVVFGFGWRDMDLCRRDNDYVMEAVARHPDRLIGFGIVNPAAGTEAVHKKQLLTYLKVADKRLGLLINCGVPLIQEGITRIAYGMPQLADSAGARR